MPLNVSQLSSDLEEVAKNPGATIPECAHAWADAIKNYAAALVPPSTTVSAAAATLEGALAGAFASVAAPAMELAFTAFGLMLASGMLPAFVGAPPAGPVGFAALFATFPPTHQAAAAGVAAAIDAWMKRGAATPALGGSPVPWT